MNSKSQVIKQNTSFIFFLGFRRTCWCLAALALLSAVLTLSCGGPSATAPAVQVSLSPQTAQVVVQGQVQFTATVSGSSAGVTWSVNGTAGGSPAVGTINGAGLYTAPGIPPSTNVVTVTAASSGQSAGASVTIVNPAPVVSSITPATVNEGSGNTKLTVTGTGFTPQSTVELGGTALATLFVNATLLTAVAPAAQLANVGSLAVAVTTPAPGGGTSSALNLAVLLVNPAPTISSITPATVFALSGTTLLTVTGSGFIPQSTLAVNGSAFPATVVSSTELTATISALMVAQPAAFNLVVSNPAPGGGASEAATFTVLAQGSVTPTGNPQVALYSFSSPRDASVSIEFGTDTTYGKSTWVQNTPPGGGAVQILVAGMLASTTYHMRADVSFPDGTQFVDSDHAFTTGALPAGRVAPITVTNPNGLTPTPGAIFLMLDPGTSNQVMTTVVDNAGNLIWYWDYDQPLLGGPWPMKLLPNGHMLITRALRTSAGAINNETVTEIDLAGNIIFQFTPADLTNWLNAAGYTTVLPVYGIPHDFVPLPNGHVIFIFNHYVECTSIPGCVGTDDIVIDSLVDLDQNHKPVWVWDALDHLCSPTSGPCLDINRRMVMWPDWLHFNTLVYSPDDGNLLVSSRCQHWVMKIDYQDGQGAGDILWRLGPQGEFTLMKGGVPDEDIDDWFYGQHDPNFVSPNSTGVFNLMVVDNGIDRGIFDVPSAPCSTPGNPACYTRVPILQVDEVGKTATILWDDNLSPVYSSGAGSARLLNDNRVDISVSVPTDDLTGSRYLEVTHDPSPQIVLRMEISGQNLYRAVHYPSLYPGVQW